MENRNALAELAAGEGKTSLGETWIALLGRRNMPVDGVADYCTFLATALAPQGVTLERHAVDWADRGWFAALRNLARQARDWRGRWVLVQYTALGWSRRGLPLGVLLTERILRRQDVRVAVVYHESRGQEDGNPLIQSIRAACQNFVIRLLYGRAERCIFTVPHQAISWIARGDAKASHIPIGANIPEPTDSAVVDPSRDPAQKTVAVFCFVSGRNRELEIGDIVHAVRNASRGASKIRLLILGKGSNEVRPEIERRLAGSGIEFSTTGILPAAEISRALARADVLLFVSGMLEQTRGSALAAVACGLPIVGYAGRVAGTSLADAGLHLAPYRDRAALSEALAQVLSDENLSNELRRRSLEAQRKYFCWDAIARRFAGTCAPEPAVHQQHRSSAVQSRGVS